MKKTLFILSLFVCLPVVAREFNIYEDLSKYNRNNSTTSKEKQYEDKITYLEAELSKYQNRLVEKSLYLEKSQDTLKTKYEQEIAFLKREVIYKTKSLLDAQRQIEKMNPSEDMKSLIKINTEMAAQIRASQDQIATSQLQKTPGRAPASTKCK